MDRLRFDCTHPSVDSWHSWSWDRRVADEGGGSDGSWRAFGRVVSENYRTIANDRDVEYWAYHMGRSLLFATQGALSLSMHGLRQFLLRRRDSDGDESHIGEALRAAFPRALEQVSATGLTGHRLFAEAILVYQQDRQHIREGLYLRPWDLEERGHRQWNPFFVARAHVEYMTEALRTLDKRARFGAPTSSTAATAATAATEVWLKSGSRADTKQMQGDQPSQDNGSSDQINFSRSLDTGRSVKDQDRLRPQPSAGSLYPDYYLNNTFHYQTDGWLSSRSARVYETSTETLFIGRQDAMQRHALVPIARFVRERERATAMAARGDSDAALDVLELGAGTGRFHTFLRDNLPPGSRTSCLDLSPFYLEQARENDRRWRRLRRRGESVSEATFIQAAAENVPLPDASQDVLVAVYLLHEVPPHARKGVAREAARLLRPGGLLVVADSIQLGDRPALDGSLAVFSSFNEPHYESYINEDLAGTICQMGGLVPEAKLIASSTKVLSFRKPAL